VGGENAGKDDGAGLAMVLLGKWEKDLETSDVN
jgi:hypothetical protein